MPRNYNDQSKIDAEFAWLDRVEDNASKYRSLVESDHRLIDAGLFLPPGYDLLRVDLGENEFEVAMVCRNTQEVVYFIKCRVWADIYLDRKPVTQVMLWRTSNLVHRSVTSGVTEEVFRNYLLKNYRIAASDSCQTFSGREFWVRQLGYALGYGEHVYRYHRLDCELQEITDHAVIRDNSCDLWGDDEEYENVLAIISLEELKKGV